MPAVNPRLSVTLKPSTASVLRRLSNLTGNSQSSMVSELLESSEPVFVRMLQVLEAATKAQAEAKAEISNGLESAQTRLEKHLGIVMEEFDQFTGDLLEGLEDVPRRGRKAAARQPLGGAPAVSGSASAAAKRPPISNRGVRSTPNHKNQQLTKAGEGVKK